jgi:galactokinase
LVVGLAITLGELSGMGRTELYRSNVDGRETLSEYLGCVENGQSYGTLKGHRGVGTFGGSEDHTAMLCGRTGQLVQYSFCPVRHERTVPFPEDRAFVIAVSGVQAEKTGAARDRYNQVSLSAREILDVWNQSTGRADASLAEALRSSPDASARLRDQVRGGGYLTGRLEQFIQESEVLIPAASEALDRGDLAGFGRAVDRSQTYAEEGLGNQTPETVALQRMARELGADAASAFGAGFGGSVWAMVDRESAGAFAVRWLDTYSESFPNTGNRATWLVTRPGAPAHRL